MTPSRHAARSGERARVGALRGYAAILGVAVVLVIAYGAFTQSPLPADAAEDGGAVREPGVRQPHAGPGAREIFDKIVLRSLALLRPDQRRTA